MSDLNQVQAYLQWLRSPEGRYPLAQKKRLVEGLLSGWPRRGHTVLEVGCGPGLFLEMLWEAGLDPTGLEESPALLDSVRKHMGSKVDLFLGKYDSLPFEDDEFDYVTLMSTLDFAENVEELLAEAFRVASKGLLVCFNNAWSFACLGKKIKRGPEQPRSLEYICPLKMFRMLRTVAGKNDYCFRTTLLGLPGTWREGSSFSFINRSVTFLPFGAVAGIRLDLAAPATGTLLPLSIGSPDPV